MTDSNPPCVPASPVRVSTASASSAPRRFAHGLLLIAAASLLAACSSSSTSRDTGPIRASTFSFINPGHRPAPAFADQRAQVLSMIQADIAENLTGRGLTRVQDGSEVTVAFLVIAGNNASTAAISDYFGYGRDVGDLRREAHRAYTTSKNPNYFEAGTLLVDILDSKTSKLLWRNHITRPLLRSLPEAERPARLKQYVDELLGSLRIAPQ